MSLSFSPNGSRLALRSYDNTTRLWDGATGMPIATLESHPQSASIDSLSHLSGGDDVETEYREMLFQLETERSA